MEPLQVQTSPINLVNHHHTPATKNPKKKLNLSGKPHITTPHNPPNPQSTSKNIASNPLTLIPSLWRSKRDADISQREEASSSKKSDRVSKAQRDIDDFYENYNSKKDKSITRTRKEAEEFLANRQDTSAGGTSWERIGKLVDLSGKGAKGGAAGGGKEKFRELLMELRKDEKAPGASGY